MGAMFKVQGVTRLLAAVCIALSVCAPFALWLDLATATHR